MHPELERILYLLPGIIIGLTFHELMHAYIALKLGDTTARDQGRLTLNPIKHIDPLGFIFILIAGFGWAKPVQINRANLKLAAQRKALRDEPERLLSALDWIDFEQLVDDQAVKAELKPYFEKPL